MGVLFEYFAAKSDAEAAAVIDLVGGPGSLEMDSLSVSGIEPVVQLGTLEALLTNHPYDEVANDPRNGHAVAVRGNGERLVLTITDSLATALARASAEDLQRVAVPWSETEEFWGTADPDVLADVLVDLAALARRADGNRLYCWVCV
ncbi:hypothetical protein ACFTSF_35385 [Kribbella sp. NPDC056951]|uniref:hypothetical protein n=1 Tax=Kribbella sp. NPDC056951 TaxID=3345978 RepID=UPI00363B1602